MPMVQAWQRDGFAWSAHTRSAFSWAVSAGNAHTNSLGALTFHRRRLIWPKARFGSWRTLKDGSEATGGRLIKAARALTPQVGVRTRGLWCQLRQPSSLS